MERTTHLAVGQTISHFRILENLGAGGMGVVYKAEDLRLKRLVALKFLSPDLTRDPNAKARFIREAQAASALDHPNICTVHQVEDTRGGECYIVMACYQGETLRQRIEREPLSIDEAIRITLQVCRGLAKAHENRIIHRDIKPNNIMITRDGVVKILDFGLAKLEGRSQLTGASRLLGTLPYMSPESLQHRPVDHRTDIWSLGVVLYEMLTRSLPFRGDHEAAVIYSIVNQDPRPLPDFLPDAPPELLRVVGRSLMKAPNERYGSVTELAGDLEILLADAPVARREAPAGRTPSYWKALGLHLVAGLGLFYVNSRSKRRWLYPLAWTYVVATFVSAEGFDFLLFEGGYGFYSYMAALTAYELGFVDVAISCYFRRRGARAERRVMSQLS